MQQSSAGVRYAVAFRSGTGPTVGGALTLDETGLVLVGKSRDDGAELRVAYSAVSDVRIGRSSEESVHGRPTVVLSLGDGPSVQIEPLGAGLLHELADRLAALALEHADIGEQVVVTVPLKKGRAAKARELVAHGPPFDPTLLGLRRHEVFVNRREAVFVFTGPHVREKFERATRNPTLWLAGLAWTSCVAGRPRVASRYEALARDDEEPVYRWAADSDA